MMNELKRFWEDISINDSSRMIMFQIQHAFFTTRMLTWKLDDGVHVCLPVEPLGKIVWIVTPKKSHQMYAHSFQI